jgi:hypothetical protein
MSMVLCERYEEISAKPLFIGSIPIAASNQLPVSFPEGVDRALAQVQTTPQSLFLYVCALVKP